MSMDETIKGLIEKRNQAWEGAKHYWESEEVTLEAADAEAAQRANEEITAYDARINELHQLNEANKKAEEYREAYERFVPQDVRERAEKRDLDALRNLANGEELDFDLRMGVEVNPDTGGYELRDLIKDTAAAGGNTVPTSFRRTLYEHMIHLAAIRQTNVTVLTTTSGEALEIPRTNAFGTAAAVGEGTAAAEADAGFGKVTLNAIKYAQLVQISRELLSDSGVDMEGFLARDLGRALGQVTGAAYVTGAGGALPRGVMTAVAADAGTAVQVASATVETDNLIDLFYSVVPPYRVNGYWLLTDSTEEALRKKKNNDDQYVWQPGIQAGIPNQILGRPVINDPNVAAIGSAQLSVAFGDFSGFFIRDVGSVNVRRSDDFAFSSDLASFLGTMRTDSDLIDTNAIAVLDTD